MEHELSLLSVADMEIDEVVFVVRTGKTILSFYAKEFLTFICSRIFHDIETELQTFGRNHCLVWPLMI